MHDQNVRGLARDQLTRMLISRFYNMEWYGSHTPNPYHLDLEENRNIKGFLLEDVIDFCMKTDVCKQLNVSALDLMNLSLPTYTLIKEIVRKDNERKAQIISEQQRDIERREKQFTGVSNAAKRRN